MSGAAFLVAALLSAGCNMENWDWFGMNKQEEQSAPRHVGKARRPANQPVAAAAPAEAPHAEDADSREVDEKVDRYVASMDHRYDPTYQRNDFGSKINRQSDPRRPARIRQTAARSQAAFPSELPPEDREPAGSARGASSEPAMDAGDDSIGASTSPWLTDESVGDDNPSRGAALEPEPSMGEPRAADRQTPIEDESAAGGATKHDAPRNESKPLPAPAPPIEGDGSADRSPVDDLETTEPAVSPPVLEEIEITAAPTAQEDSPVTANEHRTPPTPTLKEQKTEKGPGRSPEVVDTLAARFKELQSIIAADPEDLEAQFRLRMLFLIEGDDDQALAPSPGVSDEINEIIKGQIEALRAVRSAAGRDPAAWATRQLAAVEELRDLLMERADLQIPRMVSCSKVSGFGAFEPIERPEYVAGRKNQILIYVEIDNFASEKTEDGMYRTLLSVRQSLLTDAGEELWSHKDENIEDLTRRRRRDFYLTTPPRTLPKNLAPGTYVVKIEIEDVLAQKMNSETLELKIIP
jgi:hypothetical protein